MEKQSYKARAKINLALDVCRRLENGYHEVKMVMHDNSPFSRIAENLSPAAFLHAKA